MRAPRRIQARPRKGPLPYRYVLLLSFIVFVALTVQGFWIIDKGIRPTLIDIATTETKVIAAKAINEVVDTSIVDQLDQSKLFIQERVGDTLTTQFNTQIYNQVVSDAGNLVQNRLDDIEHGTPYMEDDEVVETNEGGIVYKIPLGQATNNVLLAQLGPQIPVRFSVIGDAQTNLSYEIIETGINNTTMLINFKIVVDVRIVIPFATNEDSVETEIPIGIINIQGDVPDVFSEGGMIIPSDTPTNSGSGE
ncbi:sporulation protein YunB [Bacillus suaedae]|uniref:Sporulation protein YunB n=1 Tax=Halalkalibacter suaedae TaxID=2822140 RepID=A0A940WT15_9BACI|nr:sporulation protein YunB [Bacillus suaedae]MBP3949912.1 sporulation protein YunB [Bacillus suaedae]